MSIFKRPRRAFSATPDAIIHPVIVKASRALFDEGGGIPKVALQFEDARGVVYQFELNVKETAELMERVSSAYYAILPPLRTNRQGYGG